ncbi:MAG TPA: hypothetical protein VK284_07035 [Streptosporangiaceae bacterium]|nr:hypothetical protein [Streptosporangiaceae bacterium]
MHFNLKGALGIAVPVLLSSALAVGAAALPASATTWQDTGLSATAVQAATFGGAGLGATIANGDVTLKGTGVNWSLHGTVPTGVSLSGTTISCSSSCVAGSPDIVADATDSAGNAEALVIPVTLGASSIKSNGSVVTVSLSKLAAANSSGTVTFSATSSAKNTITFAESNLPAGLASGNPVLTYVGGSAAPGTYNGVTVTATDTDGAVLNGTFNLTVQANAVNSYGDEVNRFGNGFDSYQQRQHPGAIIAGWTATQNDPATHFILNIGTHQGAYQYEYAPKGTASGLCVSDPGGGWASDPLPDGLILANCNTGPWQQFVPQSNGTLKNVATGLYVNPNGTGSQLRGGTKPTPWGGSSYTWTDYSSLPA